jgi:hypothetical protein
MLTQFLLLGTIIANGQPYDLNIGFETRQECVEAVKALSKTTDQLKDVGCVPYEKEELKK